MDSTWISFIAVVICFLVGATMSMRPAQKTMPNGVLAGVSAPSSSRPREGKVKIPDLAPSQVAFDHGLQSGGSGLSGQMAGLSISPVGHPGKTGNQPKGSCRIEATIKDNVVDGFVQYVAPVPNLLSLEARIAYHPLYVKYHIDWNTNVVMVTSETPYFKMQVEWGSRLFRRRGKFNVDLQELRMLNARATFKKGKIIGKCEFSLPFMSDLSGASVEYGVALGEEPEDLQALLRHGVNKAADWLVCAFFKHVWRKEVKGNPNMDVITEIDAYKNAGFIFDESAVEDPDDKQ